MRKTLSLVLPVLIPSWQFFKTIEPSPRVQWARIGGGGPRWQEFRPRPQRLSAAQMFKRLFYNAVWNEALFVVSCAERIEAEPTAHSITEIQRRIIASLPHLSDATLQFRLIFIDRNGQDLLYRSASFPARPAS
ncbi:hypothetical protein HTT03_12755 [Sulfitobacter sp. S0837]|uniref:hypothetical protein n=1 Tax=Sulfitobacter maritimus TaxID=2741719 RepID=UPI001581562B|nr:hypothetical protein [Sulfitobacter maritimus]NUH66156.1 hypothetical protein [Sulfitobacter maritimus]